MTGGNLEALSEHTEWLVQHDLASLEQAYSAGDVLGAPAHSLIGVEIDYRLLKKKKTLQHQDELEASRADMATELSLLVPKDAKQAERKATWLKQIPDLTPEELVNYQIYRRLSVATLDPPTPDMYLCADDSPETTLEFIFGNGLYQTGYYDNPGMFEMRTQAAKPTIAVERVKRALTVAEDIATYFGFSLHYMGDHTNMSVWTSGQDGLRPVHALDHSEGQETARRATAGMLQAARDSKAMRMPPSYYRMPPASTIKASAAAERGSMMRVLPERFEQRQSAGADGHALAALVLLSGFAHGVTDPGMNADFVRADKQDLFVPGPGYDKTTNLYLLRALQQSSVDDSSGSLVFKGRISGLDTSRLEGTLSSIIGTTVYETAGGNDVIRRLMGCISLTEQGVLVADEQALQEVIAYSSHHIMPQGTPGITLSERLRRMTYLPDVTTITGSLEYPEPLGVTFHKELEQAADAPSLGHIGRAVLAAVGKDRGAGYTHEKAVAVYCLEAATVSREDDVSDRAQQIHDIVANYPDAKPDIVMRHIRSELHRVIVLRARGIARYEASAPPNAKAADIHAYENNQYHKECYAAELSLYQALGGSLADLSAKAESGRPA